MSRRCWRSGVVLSLGAGLLGGCSTLPSGEHSQAKSPVSLICSDMSYGATMRDAAAARGIAEKALSAKLQDARGDMLSSGLRQLRNERQPTQCTAIGHEVYCKAAGSVCGR